MDIEKALVVRASRPFQDAVDLSEPYTRRFALDRNEQFRKLFSEAYWSPLVEVHRRVGIDSRFQLVLGDTVKPSTVPTFHKARLRDGYGMDILVPLNRARHFVNLPTVLTDDRPFEKKWSRLVWRGATTGNFNAPDTPVRYHLYRHWARWKADNRFGFGFAYLTPNMENFTHPDAPPIEKCRTPPMTVGELLRFKYLLCLEGNDVASGLKWMLASNSVVVMPAPTMVSWACENLLRPGVHYVECAPDLSDLEEVFDWCEANPERCEEIARNGKAFMRPFYDEAAEDELFETVVRRYHKKVHLFDPAQPDGTEEPDAADPDA